MIQTHPASLAFFNFSGWELAIILVLGLLIFGRRLPELGRSVGRTIVEFKKGLSDVQTDVNNSANSAGNNAMHSPSIGTLPPGNSQGGTQGSVASHSTADQRK